MKIDKTLMDRIAHLSRLEFDEKDADQIMKDMTAIVTWVEKLNEVNTEGVDPITSMTDEVNGLREDKVSGQLSQDDALRNAPEKRDGHFVVPKVLE